MTKLLSLILATAMAGSATLPSPRPFEPQMLGDTALSPAFSPDGQTMLFTRQANHNATIMESHRTAGGWSQPKPATFSGGKSPDTDPAFGPDGSYVVFASARPTPDAPGKHLNLWIVKRSGTIWGAPTHLPPVVNVSPYVYAPSIAADGTIYFMASYHLTSKTFEHQLYRARLQAGAYQPAQALPFSSRATKDADPLVAPDQSFVLFVSAGRRGAKDTSQYIYIARAIGSSWAPVEPLAYQGEYTGDSDCCLTFGPDGKTVLFTASRGNESQVLAIPSPSR
jgi:Tol biopolymer transport system component